MEGVLDFRAGFMGVRRTAVGFRFLNRMIPRKTKKVFKSTLLAPMGMPGLKH